VGIVSKLYLSCPKEAVPSDLELETLFNLPILALESFSQKENMLIIGSYSSKKEAVHACESSQSALSYVTPDTEQKWPKENHKDKQGHGIFTRGWPVGATKHDILAILNLGKESEWIISTSNTKDDRVCAWLYNNSLEKIKQVLQLKFMKVNGHLITLTPTYPINEKHLLLTNLRAISARTSEVDILHSCCCGSKPHTCVYEAYAKQRRQKHWV
jgi:hypothetical protein